MNNFVEAIYIGIGGFLGSITRWLVSKSTSGWLGAFPLGTLFVNVTGSFILGFIMYAVLYGKNISPELRNLSTVGFIGAYTTMSTFSYETIRLLELKDYTLFGLNLALNIILCLLAIWLGRYSAILMFKQ